MAEELNIETAVESIANDIGLGQQDEGATDEHEDATAGAGGEDAAQAGADDNAQGGDTDDTTGQQKQGGDKQAPAQVRQAPKSWAKEQHEVWSKLDPKAQEYIEQREKQMVEGLSQYSEAAKFAKAVKDVMSPHVELIRQQNIEPAQAINYLFNAHKQLSTGSEEQKTAFLAEVARTYKLDLGKAAALAGQKTEVPQYAREQQERIDRLEQERQAELNERRTAEAAKIEKQVTDFAEAKDEKGNAKHPYFDECSEHIVKLINGGYSLEDAYQVAIYANPVTKEKELTRLQAEKESALRAKAKQQADRSRSASSTNVNSRDTRRAPTASKAKSWEDGMEETYQEIKNRTH